MCVCERESEREKERTCRRDKNESRGSNEESLVAILRDSEGKQREGRFHPFDSANNEHDQANSERRERKRDKE